MDRLKKFLTDKKVSKSFKRAGTGHRLTEDTSKYASIQAGSMQRGASSQSQDRPETSVERIAAADVAAQAAYKRMNLGAKN
ncbi:unnamed protein product, partial [Anisakis simplex]|uniref:Antitoxin n=1 Tax=Anisakis simplex TaxID=6269 RepID=A0A0M3JL31_ANISI